MVDFSRRRLQRKPKRKDLQARELKLTMAALYEHRRFGRRARKSVEVFAGPVKVPAQSTES
ncbi:MAG TPA: hypothetical protein DIT76_00570 [Spartobacteria bacterium]|jgi:hypothetical protein|nr:hypothetical protein [Spartobacteria bacterium]HCP90534.1 hypothetical protein [Spartobacteria bacterium]